MVLFALVLQQKQLPSWSEVVFLLSILVAHKSFWKTRDIVDVAIKLQPNHSSPAAQRDIF